MVDSGKRFGIVCLQDLHAEDPSQMFAGLPDVMDRRRVADVLGVDPKTVSREIQRGRMRCIHVGRSVRITKQQLLEYVMEAEAC